MNPLTIGKSILTWLIEQAQSLFGESIFGIKFKDLQSMLDDKENEVSLTKMFTDMLPESVRTLFGLDATPAAPPPGQAAAANSPAPNPQAPATPAAPKTTAQNTAAPSAPAAPVKTAENDPDAAAMGAMYQHGLAQKGETKTNFNQIGGGRGPDINLDIKPVPCHTPTT